ncbi:flagellar biosynthesis repressor FlbT [Roseicitreum antarcticum]|uniref:Flagellar protein FlbT n=1 Tax=Roseicitreum antarcticum TaxID=564137 RepID=A0A1H2XAX6_9RHOB|nr:flagellar biosynthesis repressor FlbT [Roseicitreum antarcticum]SDW90053.1 flagellar protein FlbT [Roseicitreum antarcticum]
MTGLVIKLAPNERMLINGAVIENGDRRTRISILTPNANLLRLRDAIHPDDADTPVKRMCCLAQMVLAGDADVAETRQSLIRGIEQLSQVFSDEDSRRILDMASRAVLADEVYQALRSLRTLLPREERLFAVQRP